MYKCQDCDMEYKLTDSLRKHIRHKHDKNVTMTCCNFCDKVFYNMSLKAGHVSKFHADCSGSSRNTNLNENRITFENIDKHAIGLKVGITCIGKKYVLSKI